MTKTMYNQAVSIFHHKVNQHSELSIETDAQIVSEIYTIHMTIVQFDTIPNRIAYKAIAYGKSNRCIQEDGNKGIQK